MLREQEDVWEGCLLSSLKAHGDQREVPDNLRKATVASIFKKGRMYYPSYYRPVSLISGPGKIMEQELLEHISGHAKSKMTGSTQQGFTKSEACLTYLIVCCHKMLRFVDVSFTLTVARLSAPLCTAFLYTIWNATIWMDEQPNG